MKKALIVLGSIVLAIVLALGALLGYGFYRASGLNASSKAYIEANVPPIVRGWSRQELAKRASPDLVKVMHAKSERSRKVWKLLASNLGPVQNFGKVRGNASVSYSARRGKVVTGNYAVAARFAKGKATIKVRLVRVQDHWKIHDFRVVSPALVP